MLAATTRRRLDCGCATAQEVADALGHVLAWLEVHGPATAAEILAAAETDTTLSLVCTRLAPGSARDASSNARLGLVCAATRPAP